MVRVGKERVVAGKAGGGGGVGGSARFPPSLSHWSCLPGRHGGEIIGFVVTSRGCQERTSASVSDEDISVTGDPAREARISWCHGHH